jgi:hypothetical protein
MTLREIQTALRCIASRKNEKARFEAALHGMKLEIPAETVEYAKPDPAKEAFMDAQMKRLIAERTGAGRGK